MCASARACITGFSVGYVCVVLYVCVLCCVCAGCVRSVCVCVLNTVRMHVLCICDVSPRKHTLPSLTHSMYTRTHTHTHTHAHIHTSKARAPTCISCARANMHARALTCSTRSLRANSEVPMRPQAPAKAARARLIAAHKRDRHRCAAHRARRRRRRDRRCAGAR